MEVLKIWFLCIGAAVLYGVVHDQVTAHLCVEYFSIGHPPVFHTASPALLACGWGVLATWWMGAIIGYLLVLVARLGRRPKLAARALVKPIGALLAVMAILAVTAGVSGYLLAHAGILIGPVPAGVPDAHRTRYLADLWAHNASYDAGALGGIMLAVWVWRQRKRLSDATVGETPASQV